MSSKFIARLQKLSPFAAHIPQPNTAAHAILVDASTPAPAHASEERAAAATPIIDSSVPAAAGILPGDHALFAPKARYCASNARPNRQHKPVVHALRMFFACGAAATRRVQRM